MLNFPRSEAPPGLKCKLHSAKVRVIPILASESVACWYSTRQEMGRGVVMMTRGGGYVQEGGSASAMGHNFWNWKAVTVVLSSPRPPSHSKLSSDVASASTHRGSSVAPIRYEYPTRACISG